MIVIKIFDHLYMADKTCPNNHCDHHHHHDNRCHHHHHCNCDQLDLADEQAAAIRRELDARREKVQEMERVSLLIIISIRMVKIDCYCDRDLYEDDHVIIYA